MKRAWLIRLGGALRAMQSNSILFAYRYMQPADDIRQLWEYLNRFSLHDTAFSLYFRSHRLHIDMYDFDAKFMSRFIKLSRRHREISRILSAASRFPEYLRRHR